MGDFPIECVEVMNKVAIATEESINYWKRFQDREYNLEGFDYQFNIDYAVCITALNTNAKAIIAYTNTGNTARIASSFGPGCPIIAVTENEVTYRQLGLCWDIIPKLYPHKSCIDDLIEFAIKTLKEEGYLQKKDKIVIAGGSKAVPNSCNCKTGINNIIGGIVEID